MKIRQPATHLDQMLRQTRAHHVQLSAMADMKANLILTAGSLVIPLTIRYLSDPVYRWPALVMILFCVLTVVLAAYAAMPKLNSGSADPAPDVNAPGFNPLFFGSFSQLSYDQYEQAMETIMNDHDQVYEVQVREIYILGRYLQDKKYRFIRLAYLSFIAGAVCSTLLYIFQAYLHAG